MPKKTVYVDWSGKGNKTSYYAGPNNYGTQPTKKVNEFRSPEDLNLLGYELQHR